jgi:hypothetical protein
MQAVSKIGVIAASLLKVNGDMCLDLPIGDTSDGSKLEIFDCIGGDSQQFAFDAHGWLKHVPSGKCLDGSDFGDDAPPMIWECYGGEQQKISYDADAGRIYSGTRCLEISAAGSGAGLRWRECDDSMPQFFTWDSDNSLIYANSNAAGAVAIFSNQDGRCWEVPDSAAGDSQVIQLMDCVGSSNQGWVWQGASITTGLDLRMCLDIPGGDDADGNWLALYQCTGAPQQMWAYDDSVGRIYRPDTNKCADVDTSDGSGVGHLMVFECNGADSQSFGTAGGSNEDIIV